MDQATQPTTPPAPDDPELDADRAAYRHAADVALALVDQLTILPRGVAVIGDLTGYRVRLNYGTNQPAGVTEFAKTTGVDAVRDTSVHGVWLEARATIDGVPVCAEVLMSPETAAAFQAERRPTGPLILQKTQAIPTVEQPPAAPAPRPVPLGDSVLAHTQTVTPVTPIAPDSDGHVEPEGQDDEARCLRCGCTEDAACEGGCAWVPNAQMVGLCSACATPAELAASGWTTAGGES